MSVQPWLDGVSARDLALSVFRNPGGHASLLGGRGALPDDVVDVMRLAQEAARHHDEPGYDEEQHRAALFFVEHVLLSNGGDHYRVLGLARSADVDAVREHYRLMMAIFHPDRCPWLKGDRENLAARINVAYRVLRDPARRAAYDLDHGRSKTIHMPGAGQTAGIARAQPEEPLFSRLPLVVQRFFPQFVLGGVALVGLLVVLATYINRAPPEAIGMGAVKGARAMPELPDRARRPLLAMAQEKIALSDAKSAPPVVVEVPKHAGLKSEPSSPLPQTSAVARENGNGAISVKPPEAQPTSSKPDRDGEIKPDRAETRERSDDTAPARAASDTRGEASVLRVAHQIPASRPEQATGNVVDAGRTPDPDSIPAAPSATPLVAPVTGNAVSAEPTEKAEKSEKSEKSEKTEKTERVEAVAMTASLAASGGAPQLGTTAPVQAPNRGVVDSSVRVQSAPEVAVAVSAPIKQQHVATRGVGHREALALLEHFADAYRRGNLDELMTLFSENARSNSGRRGEIRTDYEGLFRLTRARDIEFHDLQWTFENERGKAEGSFVARVLAYGQDSEGVHVGQLRFELVEVGGRVLIEELFHSGSN